jgi:hypothetical protein
VCFSRRLGGHAAQHGLPAELSLALAPRGVAVALALPVAAVLGAGASVLSS